MEQDGIREILVEKDKQGKTLSIKVVFGPHFFVDIRPSAETGELTCYLGYTHHGFGARAVVPGDELEKIIDEIRAAHPALAFE